MYRYTELRSLQDRHLPTGPRHAAPRSARPTLGRRLLALVRRDPTPSPAVTPPPPRPARRAPAAACDSEPDWC